MPIYKLNKNYKTGDEDKNLLALKHNLYLLKDLPNEDITTTYTAELPIAIKSYQQRNGMEPTGKADAAFVKNMNAPQTEKIHQLLINIERCRWVPAKVAFRP